MPRGRISITFLLFCIIAFSVIAVGAFKICAIKNIVSADLRDLLPLASSQNYEAFLQKINGETVFLVSSKNAKNDDNHLNNIDNYQQNNTDNQNKEVDNTQPKVTHSQNEEEKLHRAVDKLAKTFAYVTEINVISKVDTQKTGEFYFKNRYSFTPPLYLSSKEALENKITEVIYSPFGGVTDNELQYDPFLTVRNVLMNQKPEGFVTDKDGYIYKLVDNKKYYIVRLYAKDTLSSQARQQIVSLTNSAYDELLAEGVELNYTGSLYFAEKSAQNSINDMSIIGSVSTICLLLVLIGTFRSVMPVIWSFSVLSISLLVGFATVIVIFDTIHVITMAIASSLIGICFDYILHMLMFKSLNSNTNGNAKNSVDLASQARSKLKKPLLFSLITSVGAYLIMPTTGLNILQQLGVFAIAALVTVFILVYYVVSRAKTKSLHIPLIFRIGNEFLAKYLSRLSRTTVICIMVITVVFIGLSFAKVYETGVNDDVASMQDKDVFLVQQDQNVRQILNGDSKVTWLVLSSKSSEEAFITCEEIKKSLWNDSQNDFFAPCLYTPSKKLQQQNIDIYQKNWDNLVDAYKSLDIELDKINAGVFEAKVFSWRDNPIGIANLVDENGMLLRVNASNTELINYLTTNYKIEPLDQRKEWSQAFANYNYNLNIVLYITFVISCIISAFYMKTKVIWAYVLPIAFGLVSGLLVNDFITGYFNLFTTLSCFMVIGLGTDYCVFLFHGNKDHSPETIMTLCIACLTTESAFGLLAFSDTLVISSFGIVIAVGLVAVLGFAMFSNFISNNKEAF